MFKSYFVDEKFLGDRGVLLAAAQEAQVPNAAQVIDDKTVRHGKKGLTRICLKLSLLSSL